MKAHDLRAREVLFEVEDVADVGAAPRVDRLVVVADDADVLVCAPEEAHELELRAVRVLVLVDDDVAKAAGPLLAHVFAALEETRDLAHEREDAPPATVFLA